MSLARPRYKLWLVSLDLWQDFFPGLFHAASSPPQTMIIMWECVNYRTKTSVTLPECNFLPPKLTFQVRPLLQGILLNPLAIGHRNQKCPSYQAPASLVLACPQVRSTPSLPRQPWCALSARKLSLTKRLALLQFAKRSCTHSAGLRMLRIATLALLFSRTRTTLQPNWVPHVAAAEPPATCA